jgi:hypothetical protein
MIVAGDQYAYAKSSTCVVDGGVGKAFAVLTPNTFVLFPYEMTVHTGPKSGRTVHKIQGKDPIEVIEALLKDDEMTSEILEEKLRGLEKLHEDVVYWPNHSIKRFKIWTGWIRRGLAFSQREDGMFGVVDGTLVSIRPSKDEIKNWVSLLKGDSRKAN